MLSYIWKVGCSALFRVGGIMGSTFETLNSNFSHINDLSPQFNLFSPVSEFLKNPLSGFQSIEIESRLFSWLISMLNQIFYFFFNEYQILHKIKLIWAKTFYVFVKPLCINFIIFIKQYIIFVYVYVVQGKLFPKETFKNVFLNWKMNK